jgi:hypothetical protein
METTLEIVRDLSDSQVVGVMKELFNLVYKDIPYDSVRANSEAVAEVAPLASLDGEHLDRDLSAEDSAQLGRLVLEEYANNPDLEPFVRQASEDVRGSDKLVVGVILALGVVVNLTLLVATTSARVVKATDGSISWSMTKTKAKPELVEKVVAPVVEAVKTRCLGWRPTKREVEPEMVAAVVDQVVTAAKTFVK